MQASDRGRPTREEVVHVNKREVGKTGRQEETLPNFTFGSGAKVHSREASQSAHPFEVNTIKPIYCRDVNQIATDKLSSAVCM